MTEGGHDKGWHMAAAARDEAGRVRIIACQRCKLLSSVCAKTVGIDCDATSRASDISREVAPEAMVGEGEQAWDAFAWVSVAGWWANEPTQSSG